jgi:YfiH family protein
VIPASRVGERRSADASSDTPAPYAVIADFADLGVRAVVTTRAAGSFSLTGDDPTAAVMARWQALRAWLGVEGPGARFATAVQVHGARVVWHHPGWEGWLRVDAADGHCTSDRGTGLGISVADCVPVFLAHPGGVVGLLHAGWRGTASRIVSAALASLAQRGFAAADVRVHLGPAICGTCYEVGPEVYGQLTGDRVAEPTRVDLRGLLANQARESGVGAVTVSPWCTRCDNAMFFSHRSGDAGRQVAALVADDQHAPHHQQ